MCFSAPKMINIKCPVCGVENRMTDSKCYACHTELPTGKTSFPAPPLKNAQNSQKTLSSNGLMVEPDTSACMSNPVP